MKNGMGKILWLIAGILLVFAGIVFIFTPESAVAAIVYVLGFVLLISGICSIVIFATTHDAVFGAGWVLVDGIFNILIAALLFFNPYVTGTILTSVLGMWIIFTGATRLVTSFDLKKLQIRGWGWLTLAGALGIALGVLSFFFPHVASIVIGIFIGVFFIIEGVSAILLWFYSQRMSNDHLIDSQSNFDK